MSLLKSLFTSMLMLSCAGLAQAQDRFEPLEEIETVPSKTLQKRGEHMRGPITALHTAGLMLVGFDKNTDYSTTHAEFELGREQAFNKADKDGSGTLGLFELEDWRKKVLGSLDAAPGNLAFDKDYDQRVTRDEFEATLGLVFKGADKDENGVIEFSELVRVFEMPSRPVFDEARKRPDGFDEIDRNRRRRTNGY